MRSYSFAFRQLGFFSADILAAYREDPALRNKILGFLELTLYPGIWAIFLHRIAFFLHTFSIPFIPRLISQISRFLTGIEIHPGAVIGKGFFIDHGMGVVIGETTEIGDFVLLYHGVTLGGTSLNPGKRHPTVGNHVLIGAGAKIFGPLQIGDHSQVGGGAVVTKDVPPKSIVVGNPAHVIRLAGERVKDPTETVDQVSLPDPVFKRLEEFDRRIRRLERKETHHP